MARAFLQFTCLTSVVAPVVGAPAFVIGDLPELLQSVEESGAKILRDALAEVDGDADGSRGGHPSSRGAVWRTSWSRPPRTRDLLVVGSRGHGGVTGLLLGSVSQQCAHHAACPVVIVPGGAHQASSSVSRSTRRP
jgi:nucleotide-binding universal stress UspA family protein